MYTLPRSRFDSLCEIFGQGKNFRAGTDINREERQREKRNRTRSCIVLGAILFSDRTYCRPHDKKYVYAKTMYYDSIRKIVHFLSNPKTCVYDCTYGRTLSMYRSLNPNSIITLCLLFFIFLFTLIRHYIMSRMRTSGAGGS